MANYELPETLKRCLQSFLISAISMAGPFNLVSTECDSVENISQIDSNFYYQYTKETGKEILIEFKMRKIVTDTQYYLKQHC